MAWEFVGIDTNTNNNQPQGNIQQGNIQHKFKYVGFDFGMPEGEFLQQDEEPNIFNKFVGKIREFIGFDKNNNTNDYIQLLALKEGKEVKDIYKELQDAGFPVSMAQQNIHYALSGFFHQASLGILPDDVEKVKTGNKTEDFLVELSRAGASLGGFGVSLLYGGMASDGIKLFLNTSKFAKAGDKLLYLIENGKNLLPVVKERATATGIYRALKSAGNVGIVSGITSFIENNEKYNDVWQAVKKATPEALYNAALGAGIPLSQEFFNSRLGRAIFTIGLAESVNYLASGETTPQTIINAIKTSDPEMLAHGLFNAFLDVGFGIGAAFPEAKELAEKGEIKNYIEDLNRLGNHINELQKHNVVFTNVLLKTIEKHKQELLDYTQDVDKLAKQVENNIKAQQTVLTKEMPEAIKQKTDDKQEPLVFVKPDEKSDFELVDNNILKSKNDDFELLDTTNALSRLEIRKYRPYPMMGNKEQLIAQKGYFDLLKAGVENSDRIIDAFMGTGLNSNVVGLITDKKIPIIKNEFNEFRYKAYKSLLENPDKVIQNIEKHIKVVKTIQKQFNLPLKIKKKIEAYLKELIAKDSSIYIFAQHLSPSSKPINEVKDVVVDIREDGIIRGFKTIEKGELKQRLKTVANVLKKYPHKIIKGDAWYLVDKEAKKGDLVIFDPDYVAEKGRKVAGYKATEEDKSIKTFLKKFDKIILTKAKQGVKFIITNTWDEELANALRERGFKVYKTKRRSAKSVKEELVATNFDKRSGRVFTLDDTANARRGFEKAGGRISKQKRLGTNTDYNAYQSKGEVEGTGSARISDEIRDSGRGRGRVEAEDTTYMFGGVPIPPIKDIIKKNTLEIDGAKDLSVLAYLGNIHYLKDIAKDKVARQYLQKMYKVIDDANIKGAEHWYEYSKDVFTPIEALKKDINDKDVIKTVIEASVEADAKQVDPHKLFDEKLKKDIPKEKYEKAHALIDKIFEYGKKVLREYERLPDLLKETYGLDDKFVEEWKEYIYPKIRELKYWIPRIRNVGNVVIEVYKGNTKIHSQPITDLTVMFTPSRSVVAKFYEKKLKEKYGKDVDIVVKYAREKPDFSKVDFMDIMTNVMQILDNHDIPDDVKKEIITEAFNKIKSFGFTSHSIKRSENWIRGYEENVLKAIETHFAMYNGFYQKQFMKAGFTKLFAEMPENLPRLKKVMQNVRDEMLRNKDYLDKAVAKARTLLYFKYLAGSIKNGFINVVFQQPITAMHLSAYYENKSHLNYERSLARITKAAFDVLSGNLTEEEKRIFETLDRWGILKPLKTQFFLGRTALNSMSFNKFLDFLALPMGKTEEFSRRIAALSFIRTIKKDGLSINEIANFTKEFVKDTHGVYGDLGMPIVMQGKGGLKQLAKLGQTFQTYNHSVMMGVIKEAKMDKRNWVYIAKGLMLLGALGGTQIFPMYEFGKKIYTEITGKDAEIELKKKGLDFLTEGLVHNLLGIDVSSSTSFSLPFDEFRYTGNIGDTIMSMAFGVAYQTIKDELKGAEYFFKGDYYKAIYYGLPARFLGYPFKSMQEYKMGITTNGDILLVDPYTGKPLKLTEKEFVLQSLGFTPSRIKEYKDLYYTYKTLTHYYDTKATRIRNRIRLAINNGDIEEARKWVYEMQKLNYKIYMLNKEGYGLPYHLVKTPKTMYNNSRFMMYMLNNFRR